MILIFYSGPPNVHWQPLRHDVSKDRDDEIHQSLQVQHENGGEGHQDEARLHREAVGEALSHNPEKILIGFQEILLINN